jgi:hypothetical protein
MTHGVTNCLKPKGTKGNPWNRLEHDAIQPIGLPWRMMQFP